MVSPLSKLKGFTSMVFFACAKRHYHQLSRFEIENFTSHAQSIESNVKYFSTANCSVLEIPPILRLVSFCLFSPLIALSA